MLARGIDVHRFYVPPSLPLAGEYTITGDAAHRIGRVLRMAPGDRLRLFDGGGREVAAAVRTVARGAVTVDIMDDLPPEPARPSPRLYQSLIRPNRYEWLIEKATELGAAAIVPVVSERCQVRAAELGPAKQARWRQITIEASEQSGRRALPELPPLLPLARALAGAPGLVVLPWEEERDRATPLGAALRDTLRSTPSPDAVSLFVGPEGGFSPPEVELARTAGALIVSLGPRLLRAETAAVAALAITVDALAAAL